ncbi:CHY zinc finger protein [Salinicoccus sp. CNSTN-B1]
MNEIHGSPIDEQTRCIHYHSDKDIVAIKFKCCNTYYPCYKCHQEAADHVKAVWQKEEFYTPAILCGACGHIHTIHDYLSRSSCANCHAAFNEGCALHHHLYFDV